MTRKKRSVVENPLYTEIFLLIFWNTKNHSFPGFPKNGITTREIKDSIEKLHMKMFLNQEKQSLEAYTNKISRMIKEGIITKSDEQVSNKKIRYIVHKEWIINKLFTLIDIGYEYKDIVKKGAIKLSSYIYFQDNILWFGIKNHCRRIYRIHEDLADWKRKLSPLEIEQYNQRINSTIFEILESFVYMEAFDVLDNRYKIPNNDYLSNFKLDCVKYIRKRLVKEHLYLRDNVMYDVISSERGVLAKFRKKNQKILQQSEILLEKIDGGTKNDGKK